MYVQVVTYGLAGIDESDYFDVANSVASRFAAMPGLLAKLWLGNTDEGRYGSVYLWEDREAMERFLRSDLFEARNPEFSDVAFEDFDVLENLTTATQPVLEVLAPRRQPAATSRRPASARRAPAITTAGPAEKAVTKAGPPKKATSKTAKAPKKAATKAPTKAAKKTR